VRAHTLRLLRPRPLVCGVAFSLAVTAASAFVLVALVDDLSSASLQVGDALVALALSTLAGLVSLVPGGWGVADGSLSGLLSTFGVGAGVAFSVALVYRFLDSIFRTLIGMVVLFARYRALFFGAAADEPERQLQPIPIESVVGPD
jgi:glycosyltransferase 2 family protein